MSVGTGGGVSECPLFSRYLRVCTSTSKLQLDSYLDCWEATQAIDSVLSFASSFGLCGPVRALYRSVCLLFVVHEGVCVSVQTGA